MNQQDLEFIDKFKAYSSGWETKNVPGVLHTLYPVNTGVIMPMKKLLGISYQVTISVINGEQEEWFWAKNDLERIKNYVIDKGYTDKKFIPRIYKQWEKIRKQFEKNWQKFIKTDLSKLSDQKLLAIYDSIYAPYVNESALGYLSDAVSINSEVWLKQDLERDINLSLDKEFTILTAFNFDTFVNQEKKDLLGILKIIQQQGITDIANNKKIQVQLAKHAAKYFWITNNYAAWVVLDKKFFMAKIETMIKEGIMAETELVKIETDSKKFQQEKTELLKKLNFSDLALFKLNIFEVFGQMLDLRKRCVLTVNHGFFMILKEVSRRTGLDFEILKYSIGPELPDILSHKNQAKWQDVLTKRSKNVAIFCYGDQELITTEHIDRNIFYNKISSNIEVKGSVAFKGKVIGRCKILLNSKEAGKINEGDILFASNTTPDYVPAMKKAAAFVTDLGGITSHAAIVAREMQKPCIIGTKIGTRVFKDGDMVEVDADNGIVKIIK